MRKLIFSKRITSTILVFSMLLTLFSMYVNANASVVINTDSVEIDGITYTGVVEETKTGILKVTVTNDKDKNIVEIVRNGDTLHVTEIGDSIQCSTLNIPCIEESNEITSPPSRTTSLSKDLWWGFYSYYDTNPAGSGDVYWSIKKNDRYPYSMTYYAYHGTPLMNYSNNFDYEVNQLINWQYATIAITGADIAITIASLLTASMIAAPALLVAALLALGTVATAAVPLINAWSAAKEAEKKFDFIGGILGY